MSKTISKYAPAKEALKKGKELLKKRAQEYKKAKGSLYRVQEKIKDCRVDGIDISEFESSLKIAEDSFDKGDYSQASIQTEELIKALDNIISLRKTALKTIKSLKIEIERARNDNLPVSEDMIKKASDSFNNKDYDKALKHAKIASSRIKVIKDADRAVEDASKIMSTGEVTKYLAEARELFENKKIEDALTKAQMCIAEINRIKSEENPVLSVTLPSEGLAGKIWNRCYILVNNTGKVHAKDVHIELKGVVEAQGDLSIPFIMAGGNKKLDVALKSENEGSLPIIIKTSYANLVDDERSTIEESTWLNIGQGVGTEPVSDGKTKPTEPIMFKKEYSISKSDAEEILFSSVDILIPNYLDSNTTSEIILQLNNDTAKSIEDIYVDFSILERFFEIDGKIEFDVLLPGMSVKKTIKIKSKYEEGVFPVKIKITGSGAKIEREYTIKVGGTEIY